MISVWIGGILGQGTLEWVLDSAFLRNHYHGWSCFRWSSGLLPGFHWVTCWDSSMTSSFCYLFVANLWPPGLSPAPAHWITWNGPLCSDAVALVAYTYPPLCPFSGECLYCCWVPVGFESINSLFQHVLESLLCARTIFFWASIDYPFPCLTPYFLLRTLRWGSYGL